MVKYCDCHFVIKNALRLHSTYVQHTTQSRLDLVTASELKHDIDNYLNSPFTEEDCVLYYSSLKEVIFRSLKIKSILKIQKHFKHEQTMNEMFPLSRLEVL